MNLSAWIISLSAAALGILISITAYFAQKWIGAVDESLKEHAFDFKELFKEVILLKSLQSAQTKDITKTIQNQLATVKLPYSQIDEVKREVEFIKLVVQEKVLPKIDAVHENFGRVIVLENSVKDQNNKLLTMYNAMKLLAQKVQK